VALESCNWGPDHSVDGCFIAYPKLQPACGVLAVTSQRLAVAFDDVLRHTKHLAACTLLGAVLLCRGSSKKEVDEVK
jgi:hypothetical protein